MREKQDVANAGGVCQQHDQAVYADADTGCQRHPMLEGYDVILIEMHSFFIPRFGQLVAAQVELDLTSERLLELSGQALVKQHAH